MRDYDDYVERECECGHGEHRGPCRRATTVHYRPGQVPDSLEASAEPCRWNGGATYTVQVPCKCAVFHEYEGPGEPDFCDPPEYDREADLEAQEAPF